MTCTLCRLLTEKAADDGRTPPAWTVRHLETCPACRAWRMEAGRLAARLRAVPAPEAVSSPLHGRIMAGLDGAGPRPAAHRAGLRIAGVLAVAAMAATAIWRLAPPTARDRAPGPAESTLAVFLPSLDAFLNPIPEAVAAPLEVTLQREVEALKSDMTAAGSYLLACTGIDG